MPAIAITGGIATGKSTFTKLFAAAAAAAIFDTDACARQLLEGDLGAIADLRAEFGPGVFATDGGVDRAALREVVFTKAGRRQALEAILHPRVRAAWRLWLETRLQTAPRALSVVEIPLLYETGAAAFFDEIIVVGCSLPMQLRRLTGTRGLSEEMARRIIASQGRLAQKILYCHHLIWNDGSESRLRAQTALCVACYQRGEPWREAP